MNLTHAIARARAMISPSPEDEALDLDAAIAEVRRIVAADGGGPEPDLEAAIRQVREILEQERRSGRDVDAYTLESREAAPRYDNALQDLLTAYVRSQCDLHALIGAVALRSMRSSEGLFAEQVNGLVSAR